MTTVDQCRAGSVRCADTSATWSSPACGGDAGLESFDPASCRDDAWRHNEPPPIPPMSAAQALQALFLRYKQVRLWDERPDRRRRRGEARDMWSARLKCK